MSPSFCELNQFAQSAMLPIIQLFSTGIVCNVCTQIRREDVAVIIYFRGIKFNFKLKKSFA